MLGVQAGQGQSNPLSSFLPSPPAHELLDQSWNAGLLDFIWNVCAGRPPSPPPRPSAGSMEPWGEQRGAGAKQEARCE